MGPGEAEPASNTHWRSILGPPNRPYSVLGSVDVDAPVGRLFERSEAITTLKPAVREAGQHGADAIIVIGQGVETRGYSTMSFANANSNMSFSGVAYGNGIFTGNANTTANAFGSSFTTPIRHGQARVLAIKFI